MPNVAGVQFPYTPQGEQAAQLYQRSLSPRRGLGFRPIRMQEGSTPEHENAMLYIKWAHGEGSDSLPPQFQMNATSVAELLVIMRNDPEAAVKYANKLKNVVENRSSVIGEVSGGAPMEEELLGNLGRREALRAAGDTRLSDQDLGTIGQAMGEVEDIRELAGTQPYLYGPSPPTTEIFNQRIEPLRRLERRPERRPEPWEFGGVGVDSPTPQGMAHGGVPRGTVAGELEPRGYLTARQAGETMRERAKGLRNRRNYGGGIGSLYNRYG